MIVFNRPICTADLRCHHINNSHNITDIEYVKVANSLQKMITNLLRNKNLNVQIVKDIAIRLALHLEDTVADAGVWRAFCTAHHRLYGKWLPFYCTDDDMPLDRVTEQSCSFIIWMTLTSFKEFQGISLYKSSYTCNWYHRKKSL